MPAKPGKIKSGATFVRFYPTDWRSGCIGLTLDQEGLYWRICAHYYETGMRLPLDDTEAAHRIGLNPKNYRRVRDQLLNLGKITQHEDGYANHRAERELQLAGGATAEAEIAVGATRDGPRSEHQNGRDQVSERGDAGSTDSRSIEDQSGVDRGSIANQSSIAVEKSEQILRANKEPVANSQNQSEAASSLLPSVSDLKKLSDRLHAIAGPCLSSQAIAPGLAAMTWPQMWIDQGADLERDIVPAIQAQVARGRRNISCWSYFTKPVAELRAKRLAGLPAVDISAGTTSRFSRLDMSKIRLIDCEPSEAAA